MVCVYVGAHVCVQAAGEGVAWVGVGQSVFLKDSSPAPQTPAAANLVLTPGWETGTHPSLTPPAELDGPGGGRREERTHLFLRFWAQMGLE